MLFTIVFASALQITNSTFKPNESFDIYYVNLESEAKRRTHVETILSAANCNYSRFNAVHGKSLKSGVKKLEDYTSPLGLFDISFPDFSDLPENWMGMVGCKLSHYILLRKIETLKSQKPILILEDDIDIDLDFVQKIETALIHMPSEWDILLVSPHFNSFNQSFLNENPTLQTELCTEYFKQNLSRVKCFFETSGFIVNGANAAKKIADLILTKDLKNCPIDLFLSGEAENQNLIIYALNEKLVIQLTDVFCTSISTSSKIAQLKLCNSLTEETVRLIFQNKVNIAITTRN